MKQHPTVPNSKIANYITSTIVLLLLTGVMLGLLWIVAFLVRAIAGLFT